VSRAGPPERSARAERWPEFVVLLHSYIVLYGTSYEKLVHRTGERTGR
jgi:hypothetical protein